MPENLTMGFFAFGAILILISLLGGGFNIFSIGISTRISNPVIRGTAFILGIGFILLALNPAVISNALGNATNTPSPVSNGDDQINPQPSQTSTQTVQPDPPPTETSTQPVVLPDTPVPPMPSPTDFVLSYWQNVSGGRYENAWTQLSPEFRRDNHNNDYNDYVPGSQQMNLCGIEVKDVNLLRQDSYSAVVTAHSTYHTGPQCNSNEYNFEMWLIYDGASNLWLFHKNMFR